MSSASSSPTAPPAESGEYTHRQILTIITGLPLPFVSYGGSAMFANWMAVGLLLNVGRGRPE